MAELIYSLFVYDDRGRNDGQWRQITNITLPRSKAHAVWAEAITRQSMSDRQVHLLPVRGDNHRRMNGHTI